MPFLAFFKARKKMTGMALLALVYLVALALFDFLTLPVRKDELHFWPTSLLFSQGLIPDLETLRSYRELNTPLPFLLYGWLEFFFGGGLTVGRAFNLLLSFVMLGWVLQARKEDDWVGPLAVLGILFFPYYLGISLHLYTDIIATFFALLGVRLHLSGRLWWAAVSFALAISSRQYMVAFPGAILLWEYARSAAVGNVPWKSLPGHLMQWLAGNLRVWLPLVLSLATLGGWYLFFGGFAPRMETERQAVATDTFFVLLPRNSLYFLATVGAYFVIPEWLLFNRRIKWHAWLADWRRWAVLGLPVVVLYVIFPPWGNSASLLTMGYMDIAARMALPYPLRMVVYCLLTLLAVFRFSRLSLSGMVVLIYALLMLKAHIAWDKYALPVLVVLWFLLAWGESKAEKSTR